MDELAKTPSDLGSDDLKELLRVIEKHDASFATRLDQALMEYSSERLVEQEEGDEE